MISDSISSKKKTNEIFRFNASKNFGLSVLKFEGYRRKKRKKSETQRNMIGMYRKLGKKNMKREKIRSKKEKNFSNEKSVSQKKKILNEKKKPKKVER